MIVLLGVRIILNIGELNRRYTTKQLCLYFFCVLLELSGGRLKLHSALARFLLGGDSCVEGGRDWYVIFM